MSTNPKGKLFVISGPSGVGKGTLCSHLIRSDSNMILSVSVTERPPRRMESHGKNYLFVNHEKFDSLIEHDELLEWNKYGNYRYGTPKKQVLDAIGRGVDVILEIEVNGAGQVKKNFPQTVTIFVMPPSINQLRKRLMKRNTESKEQITQRLLEAENEIRLCKKYDYVIINDKVDKALVKLSEIIKKERGASNQ